MTEVKEIKMNEIDKDEIRVAIAIAIFTKALHDIVECTSSPRTLLASIEGASKVVADFYRIVMDQTDMSEFAKAAHKQRFLLDVKECLDGGLNKFLEDHQTKKVTKK